jgi:hypothetical protein
MAAVRNPDLAIGVMAMTKEPVGMEWKIGVWIGQERYKNLLIRTYINNYKCGRSLQLWVYKKNFNVMEIFNVQTVQYTLLI